MVATQSLMSGSCFAALRAATGMSPRPHSVERRLARCLKDQDLSLMLDGCHGAGHLLRCSQTDPHARCVVTCCPA